MGGNPVIWLAVAAVSLAADSPERVVGPDRALAATVHGVPARLSVDPGAPSVPVFNPDFAARAGFKAGMFGTMARIGPVIVAGKSAVVRLDLGGGEFKRRVTWFAAPFVADADGTIGPGGLPDPVIRFDLRPPQPGERSVTLPLADFGWSGMGTWVTVGDRPVAVRFSLAQARTLASAAAGAAIAAAQGGGFDRAAERTVIHLAVERPVRHVALATPLRIGPFALAALWVRTQDFGSAAGIHDTNAPDPDEIVVAAQTKQKQSLLLEIGRDDLDRCSSIRFDKPRQELTLTCR